METVREGKSIVTWHNAHRRNMIVRRRRSEQNNTYAWLTVHMVSTRIYTFYYIIKKQFLHGKWFVNPKMKWAKSRKIVSWMRIDKRLARASNNDSETRVVRWCLVSCAVDNRASLYTITSKEPGIASMHPAASTYLQLQIWDVPEIVWILIR